MEKEKRHINELISNYLNSKSTLQRIREIEEWINSSRENFQYFIQQLESYTSNTEKNQKVIFDKAKAYKKFRIRIQSSKTQSRNTSFRLSILWHYAAAIVLLCIISYFSYWKGMNCIKANFSNVVVEAPMGSKTKLHLPDGTLVWLNAGSSISYSQGFGINSRKVTLEGEGYFEVTHNDKVPFFVQTNNLEVKVLGTKFNFKDYKEDTRAMVTLIEGCVTLHNLLHPEKIVY